MSWASDACGASILIPPPNQMIVYAVMTKDVLVVGLFAAGVLLFGLPKPSLGAILRPVSGGVAWPSVLALPAPFPYVSFAPTTR